MVGLDTWPARPQPSARPAQRRAGPRRRDCGPAFSGANARRKARLGVGFPSQGPAASTATAGAAGHVQAHCPPAPCGVHDPRSPPATASPATPFGKPAPDRCAVQSGACVPRRPRACKDRPRLVGRASQLPKGSRTPTPLVAPSSRHGWPELASSPQERSLLQQLARSGPRLVS